MRNDIARFAAVAVFALLSVQGIWGAADQLTISDTPDKIAQTGGLVLYGLSGLGISYRAFRRKARRRTLETVWSVGIVLATSLAPAAWGNAPWFATATSTVAGCLIVTLMMWLLRVNDPPRDQTDPSHHDR